MLSTIIRAAQSSFPGLKPQLIYLKLKFILAALRHQDQIKQFYLRMEKAGYSRVLQLKPSVLGVVIWPYVHNQWNVETKLNKIALHYEIVPSLPSIFALVTDKAKFVIDLNSFSDNCWIGIDRPIWFIREGEIVVNIFQKDLRVVSLAFIFSKENESEQSIIIGAIQGIHRGIESDISLSIFKTLTKEFAGLRPRSLIIEIIRMIAKLTNTTQILAISEENRQHRHKYFGDEENTKLLSNYNDIWIEHGGVSLESGFYKIPVEPERKDIEDIPSKKRSMYRRRAEILESINEALAKRFSNNEEQR